MSRKASPVAHRALQRPPGMFERSEQASTETPEPATPRIKREKRTYHLPEDVVLLLSELQLHEYRRTGKKPELSDLVSEAIRQFSATRQQDGGKSSQRAS